MQLLKGITKLKSIISPLYGLYPLLWLRLFFGYYFKLKKSVFICSMAKLYCIAGCLFAIIFYYQIVVPLNYGTIGTIFYNMFMVVDIILNAICSLISEEDYVLEFSSNLAANLPGFKQTYALPYLMIFAACTLETISFACTGYGTYLVFDYYAFVYEFLACFYSRLTILYITDNYRKAVQYICKSVRDKLENEHIDITQKTEYSSDFVKVFIMLRQYLDSTTKFMRMKYLSVVMLWYLEITLNVIMISLPSLLMEMAANYLDDLKRILVCEMVSNEDEEIGDVIDDELDYIDACSTNYAIWNDYPLNMNLILSFFDLCTSYLIALLQFLY
ncbi:hypothetical protein SFRURICE_000462 [Spodoptera frugiperda]|nr:hypothetical protein SFRURICE_000462 [Spodoptera frugiperda]